MVSFIKTLSFFFGLHFSPVGNFPLTPYDFEAKSLPQNDFSQSFQALIKENRAAHQDLEFIPDGGYCFSIFALNTYLAASHMYHGKIPNTFLMDEKTLVHSNKVDTSSILNYLDKIYRTEKKKGNDFFQIVNNFKDGNWSSVGWYAKEISQITRSHFFNSCKRKSCLVKGISIEFYWVDSKTKTMDYKGRHIVGVLSNLDESDPNDPLALTIFDSRKHVIHKIWLKEEFGQWQVHLDSSFPVVRHLEKKMSPEQKALGSWIGKVCGVDALWIKKK